MPIPGNEERSIRKVAKRRQVPEFGSVSRTPVVPSGLSLLSANLHCYFMADLHPRLYAVPNGTKTKTIALRIREQKSRETLRTNCHCNPNFLTAQAKALRLMIDWRITTKQTVREFRYNETAKVRAI